MLDKTGTVTTGEMALVEVTLAEGEDRAQVLRLAGALEDGSEHPIARAIARAARDETGPLPSPEGFANREGLGVEGVVDGHGVIVGRPALLADWGLALDGALGAALESAQAAGRTAVAAAWDGEVRALLVVSDTIKPSSAEAIGRLRDLGLRPVLLSGDNAPTARAVAAEVGIDEVIAEVLPSEKAEVVGRLQREGGVVAMVGDGVNDAPALAQADLGLAIGTGTDVAIEASDITLVSGDLRAAADAIRLSRRTLGTIKGNLFWAFAYNVAALPLAALGYLDPLIAGAAMALSSVFVVVELAPPATVQGRAGSLRSCGCSAPVHDGSAPPPRRPSPPACSCRRASPPAPPAVGAAASAAGAVVEAEAAAASEGAGAAARARARPTRSSRSSCSASS